MSRSEQVLKFPRVRLVPEPRIRSPFDRGHECPPQLAWKMETFSLPQALKQSGALVTEEMAGRLCGNAYVPMSVFERIFALPLLIVTAVLLGNPASTSAATDSSSVRSCRTKSSGLAGSPTFLQ